MYTVSGNDLSEKTKFQLNGEISSLAYSPNGDFLAVTSGRNIMVHETASYQVRLSVYLSVCLFVSLVPRPCTKKVCLGICLLSVCLPVCFLSVCLSTCLPAHPSACCCCIWWCSVASFPGTHPASFPGLPTIQFLIT